MQQISNNAHIHRNKSKDLNALDMSNDRMRHLEFGISESDQDATHLAVIHHRRLLDKKVF